MSETDSAPDYTTWSTTDLYETMYDFGTAIDAHLIALQNQAAAAGDRQAEAEWEREALAMHGERAAIDVHDRPAQIEALVRWRDRAAELRALRRSSP